MDVNEIRQLVFKHGNALNTIVGKIKLNRGLELSNVLSGHPPHKLGQSLSQQVC